MNVHSIGLSREHFFVSSVNAGPRRLTHGQINRRQRLNRTHLIRFATINAGSKAPGLVPRKGACIGIINDAISTGAPRRFLYR
jgi:hypothetical protein